MPSGQYVDWEHLHAYSEGDRSFEQAVISAFCQQMQTQRALMAQALLDEDFETLARAVHQIKGASGNLGAERLYQHLIQCEHAVVQADIQGVQDCFREAEQILQKTCAEFQRIGFSTDAIH
jgi:HPt (histidine-containing phosphotransfer) domain-containing protein